MSELQFSVVLFLFAVVRLDLLSRRQVKGEMLEPGGGSRTWEVGIEQG